MNLQEDLKQAMRDKDTTKLNVLRQIKSSIQNAALLKGNVNEDVSELEIIGIIRKEISKREDAIKMFVSSLRDDLILAENSEIEVLKTYLPVDLTEDELRTIVLDSICHLAARTKRDMGRVIQRVVLQVEGKADNKKISKMVSELLT
jgi:uncharacterized protein YqeY|tara:strand:- start:7043 stop:7483 length:441 start_codon:yes stop_codon:yes gene_type:complete